MKDLSGQKFGMLTVIKLKVTQPWRKKSYLCRCDCSKLCTRLESTLIRSKRDGRISSCGCYTKRNLKPNDSEGCRKAGLHRQDSFVNGSNVQLTFRNGTVKTNTSGAQGISWSRTARKWHCYVGYQNYRTNLGFYEDINDAIKIREAAEEAIKENKFEDFYFELRGRKLDETKKIVKNVTKTN